MTIIIMTIIIITVSITITLTITVIITVITQVAGQKAGTLSLLPYAVKEWRLRLVPLKCGPVPLPHLQVTPREGCHQHYHHHHIYHYHYHHLQVRSVPSKASLMDPSDFGAIFVHPVAQTASSSSLPTAQTPAVALVESV
jgi:hypothetical protein